MKGYSVVEDGNSADCFAVAIYHEIDHAHRGPLALVCMHVLVIINFHGWKFSSLQSCQVSQNGQDSPGIWAYVPAVVPVDTKGSKCPEIFANLDFRRASMVPKIIYKPFRSEDSSSRHSFQHKTFASIDF